MLRGIFTLMLQRYRERLQERIRLRRLWKPVDELANAGGLPREWIVCPNCNAIGWRVPPHGIDEPCPLIVAMSEAASLRLDAERMLAARQGVNIEALTRYIEMHSGEDDE